MNWYDKPEWQAFTAAVLKNPDCDTSRLVAADWLDEQDDPAAAARAKLIRIQCGETEKTYRPLRPGDYAGWGLAEPVYQNTAGLLVRRGWPVWAVFLPQRFNERTVAPVFKLAPLTTCSTVGMAARRTHRVNESENLSQSTEAFLFYEGPEDLGGFVHDYGELSEFFTPGDFHRIARTGGNLHAEVYRDPGYIPFPIYQRLPLEGGAGGTRSLRRRDMYRHNCEAAEAAMKAAWKVGREWARLPNRVNRHIPKPEAFAVWASVLTTVANVSREELDTLPPAPTLDVDPFAFLHDGFRLAARQKGRPLSETLA